MDFERAALEAMTRPSPPNASGELPAKTMSDRRGSRRVGPNRASIVALGKLVGAPSCGCIPATMALQRLAALPGCDLR